MGQTRTMTAGKALQNICGSPLTADCLWLVACCLLLAAYCVMVGVPVFAQEPPVESLSLPAVVITGTDQSKIQRQIPKVLLQTPLRVIMQSSRDSSDMLVRQGDTFSITQPAKAEKYYAQAVILDPTNSQAYLRLGDMYSTTGTYNAAAEAYQKALQLSENLLEAHYKLGILYERQLGDIQKVREHYQAYLQLGGTDQRVKIWLRNVEREDSPK